MSNASSPRPGANSNSQSNGPSPSAQSQPVRYQPYPKAGVVASNGMRAQMMPSGGMVAMANNGQVIMANQVQIANPAQLQARLTNPYMVGGAQMMMGGAQMVSAGGVALAGAQVPMLAAAGDVPMMAAPHPQGMMMAVPQMQYVQPGAHLAQGVGVPSGTGVAYQSQPVTYQNQAGAAHTQPPPPPAGNPPKDNEQNTTHSRSSTPQTHPKSEPLGGGGNGGLGPDFNEMNERLQLTNKEQRAEISKLQKENAKLREKVKKLSKENHAATKSYTVKDGKCPFCLQEMPKNQKT